MVFEVTLYRMGIFFIILMLGFACGKLRVIRREYLPELAKLITKVFLPVMIFENTVAGSTRETLFANLPVLAFGVLYFAVAIPLLFGVARALRLPPSHNRAFVVSFAFGNTGFVGIPLLAALFPGYGLLFMAIFAVVEQPLFWTYGVSLASGAKRAKSFSSKDLVNPNTVALLLAFVFILAQLHLPVLAQDTLKTVSSATSALCMMYLGALLCFSDWLSALKVKELYAGIALKMVAAPVVLGYALAAIGVLPQMATCMVVFVSLPVMTVVPMVVEANGGDGDYAAGIAVATKVACVVTMPLVRFLVSF